MNDSNGIFWLGYCHEYGIGVKKDETKAFDYYQKSADMNNSDGMFQVGYCYYLGIGVKSDKHKAFTYYQKSSEAGNPKGTIKTAICYRYGVGVTEDYDKFRSYLQKNEFPYRYDRIEDYGACSRCGENNTNKAWCQTCDPDLTIQGWTSRNKDIDDCMKLFQLKTTSYENMVEWIPFDRLTDIKEIGKGGFGSVFSANWLDGKRIIDGPYGNFTRARKKPFTVALKTLYGSKENIQNFLKEFKNSLECCKNLGIYGLTQNTETNEYFMVFQYATEGSLHTFLRKKFQDLTWQIKLQFLVNISDDLTDIHGRGYVHADFHSGNILQDYSVSVNGQSYITDLGLSRKNDENNSEDGTYGVMPYVAPEVLLGQKNTQASDIYGFGVIMSEMSTGQRPFDGYKFDTGLAVKICKGLRPEFTPGTPNCYVELAMQCMNSDPQKRPSAYAIWNKLYKWNEKMYGIGSDPNEIKKQFLEADKIVKELQIASPKHPDSMYTSKFINTQKVSSANQDSSEVGLYISDNF